MDDLDKYLAQLQADIHTALVNDIANGAKEIMKNAVENVVYSAYNPTVYSRRGEDGGLSDKSNMIATEIPNGIALTDEIPVNNAYGVSRFANDKSLAEIVCEGGQNYMYGDESYDYYQPRDFMSETQNILNNGNAEKLVKDALVKKGYKFT
ncbi:MAG: hypothetical protein RSF73_03965 [Ruthenibacterium sp.]